MSQHYVFPDQSSLLHYEEDGGDFEMFNDALEEYKRDPMSFVAELEKKRKAAAERENPKMPPQELEKKFNEITTQFHNLDDESVKKRDQLVLQLADLLRPQPPPNGAIRQTKRRKMQPMILYNMEM